MKYYGSDEYDITSAEGKNKIEDLNRYIIQQTDNGELLKKFEESKKKFIEELMEKEKKSYGEARWIAEEFAKEFINKDKLFERQLTQIQKDYALNIVFIEQSQVIETFNDIAKQVEEKLELPKDTKRSEDTVHQGKLKHFNDVIATINSEKPLKLDAGTGEKLDLKDKLDNLKL